MDLLTEDMDNLSPSYNSCGDQESTRPGAISEVVFELEEVALVADGRLPVDLDREVGLWFLKIGLRNYLKSRSQS